MPWVQDASGDWVLVDVLPLPGAGTLPYTPGESKSNFPMDDVDRHPREEGPALAPAPGVALYRNEDDEIVAQWESQAIERGNTIRHTAAGVFEVDADGRIISEMPLAYRKV